MLFFARYTGLLASVGLLLLTIHPPLSAQQRLDVGIHFTPQTTFVRSDARREFREGTLVYTEGGSGVDLGYGFGGYLEYEVLPGLSLRAGIDVSRKRYRYEVREVRIDGTPSTATGTNRVVFMAIEVPVAVIYRFDYLPNNDRFLVGAGGVAGRWVGDPLLETDFYEGSSNHPPLAYSPYSLKVFTGYEHYIGSRFLVGIEPYVSYAPRATEFRLESRTTALTDTEAGVTLTLRFDN